MNKYLPYTIIGILIVLTLLFVSNRPNPKTGLSDTTQNETVITETSPSPVPVSQVVLDNKSTIDSAIDDELNQIDKELNGINDYNLDSKSLSDDQLGL